VSRPADLSRERAKRWWQTRRPIASLGRAAAFIEDVGFALLFPSRGIEFPSLFQAASEQPIESISEVTWGPDAERAWGWKDELPRQGLAWYGRFLRGRPSFLSPALLADLYPRTGEPADFTEAGLRPEARRVAEILLLSGPTSTATLREALGAEGRRGQARFSRTLDELGRTLVVTHFGTEEQGPGWPAVVLELTSRAFSLRSRRRRPEEARLRAAGRFVDTMVRAEPEEMARAFRLSSSQAAVTLEALVARGRAVRDGQSFLAPRS
jgi:hypothetical protein